MSNLTPYQKKAVDYKNHISLVANAGSGKTFVLGNRFIEIYLNEEIELSSIVAITFTDKAVGDLRRKIALYIKERLENEKAETKKKKLIELQRELVDANISTIHSFCKNLLKEFSTEAEIDSSFQVINENDSQDLIELSIEDVINRSLNEKDKKEKVENLIRFFSSKFILSKEIKKIIDQRKIILQLYNQIYTKDVNEIGEILNSKYEQFFSLYAENLLNELFENINHLTKNLSVNGKNDLANQICDIINKKLDNRIQKIKTYFDLKHLIFTTNNTIRKKIKIDDDNRDVIAKIETITKDLNSILSYMEISKNDDEQKIISILKEERKIFNELALIGKNISEIVLDVIDTYNKKKKQKAYLDFEDLLIISRKLLNNENVIKSLQSKYKYIMIDEYQDTNEIQYEIIMPILEDLRKGNLFVVGDEKQSIYSFRDAELEVFDKTKDKIKNHNSDGLLYLPHSFRMQPKLVVFINYLFNKLFSNPQKEFNEVEYNELISTKSDVTKGNVSFIIADESNSITEESLVAKKIKEIISNNTNYKFSDIAILCRKRNLFQKIENEFVKHKIPFSIVGGKGFYQQQSIYDIYNYLNFLLNEKEDASLIAILRSPFFNLSDLDLYKINLCDGLTFFEKLKECSKNNSHYSEILRTIKVNKEKINDNSPSQLIRKILIESGYWAFVSHKEDSEQEIVNLEKLISIAREYTNQPFKNIYDFVEHLKLMINKDENEGQAPIADDQNSVKIMTIHQSKGLEFKIVFLFGSNDNTIRNIVKEKNIIVDKNFGVITKIFSENYYKSFQTPLGSMYNFVNRKKQKAELKRLLYVALTRAEDELYISAQVNNKKENNVSENSFFELICEAFPSLASQSVISIYNNVKIMDAQNDFKIHEQICNLEINIEHDILDKEINLQSSPENISRKINLDKIIDKPKNEIISATKISIYEQCPVKYQLTYEIGFQPLIELIKQNVDDYEFQLKEESNGKDIAKIKGKIIHDILNQNLKNDLLGYVRRELNRYESYSEDLAESIEAEIKKFYNSEVYKKISSYNNFKNEYEIYSYQNDYILYGIIDKLILLKDKLIIIDYKTDNISSEEINQRAKDYFSQLMFYAVILSKLKSEIKKITLKLIFTKHPSVEITKIVSSKEISEFENKIKAYVENIYNQNYSPNKNHCKQCFYYLKENVCIKEYQF